jgi:hypothetical protein
VPARSASSGFGDDQSFCTTFDLDFVDLIEPVCPRRHHRPGYDVGWPRNTRVESARPQLEQCYLGAGNLGLDEQDGAAGYLKFEHTETQRI